MPLDKAMLRVRAYTVRGILPFLLCVILFFTDSLLVATVLDGNNFMHHLNSFKIEGAEY